MTRKLSPYVGMYPAANNHYHGMRSLQEHGAIEHAYRLSRILLREGIARTEEEAISMAHYEIQRLQLHHDGVQVNRMARDELRALRERPQNGLDPLMA